MKTPQEEITELKKQLEIMDGALAIAAELACAIGELIPKRDGLSKEDERKWGRVVNAIFKASDYADEHQIAGWSGKPIDGKNSGAIQ